MMSVILDVVYVTSFHNPLARECHMAKPELNVMGFVFAQRKRSCGGGPGREGQQIIGHNNTIYFGKECP